MDLPSKVRKRLQGMDQAITSKDLDKLMASFQLDSVDSIQEIRMILDDEPHILASLCRLGAVEILEYLLGHLPLDLNKKHNGMTCLQYACLQGHKDIVNLLIKIGCKLNENVSEEQSEFYLASLHGHYDITNLLLKERPDLLLDTHKCYCLFHAACKGGHVGMMQKWLRPDMDVNSEVAFVSSLRECENQFPLFAACQGSHYEAAIFLIGELKAKITRKLCETFPQFICRVVQNLFKRNEQGRIVFDISSFDLEFVQPMWFESATLNQEGNRSSDNLNEVQVDLSKNMIRELPPELLWEMPDLVDLCVSNNPLSHLPDPVSNACLQISCLTSLDLSSCQLTRLNKAVFSLQSLKTLTASHNNLEELYEQKDAPLKWKCKYLEELDLSHNALQLLPQDIQDCVELKNIDLSNNQLTGLCPPWQCPLKYLDISYNKITSFPPSADQFWTNSLKKMNASNNHLDQLPESVVKMKTLIHLNLSNNKISEIPADSLWLCPLNSLNLSHNKLGSTMGHSTAKSVLSLKRTRKDRFLTFPGASLRHTLTELFLGHNDLLNLPHGVCDAYSLSELDLSFNDRLTSLPYDIGRLKNLILLDLEGLKFKDSEIRDIVKSVDDSNKGTSASEFVKFMESKRRKCRHHDVVKMVVFGCKSLGDQCLVKKLISLANGSDYSSHGSHHKTLEVSDLTIRYTKKYQTICKRNLMFRIWEMPEIKITSTVHPCFLTQNSLYLLIHNVSSLHEDINKVSSQILAIQSCVTTPSILVVGLFPCAMDPGFKSKLEISLNDRFTSKFKCTFVSVTFSDKATLGMLRQSIYVSACAMQDSSVRKARVIDREVPEFFITAYEMVKNLKLPFYEMEQFTQETGLIAANFDDKIGDKLTLHEYLLQVGAMLHYKVQMSDLGNIVIIDPVWLFDLLAFFLQNFVIGGKKQAKMSREDIKKCMQGRIDDKLFQPFITLLEISNIAIQIVESKGKESLLIPSLLPKQPPPIITDDDDNSLSTSRFYPLPAVPASLWSHVISHLSAAIERFRDPTWKFQDLVEQRSSFNSSESLRKSCHRSAARGLYVMNKSLQFWRTGILIWHDQGFVVVDQVNYHPGGNTPSSEGILITAKTTTDGRLSSHSSKERSTSKVNLKKLSIIGIVKDEIEEVLELFHPQFHNPIGDHSKPMAICPHCYNIKPGTGVIQEEITHFYVRDCAQRILWDSIAFCNNTPVLLERLMPELLFLELPPKFVIAPDDINISSIKLGHGMAGTVSKGHYKEREVAIKIFHKPMYEPAFTGTYDDHYSNTQTVLSLCQPRRIDDDKNDTEQRKISNAFSDIRREVGILSKLLHKCIISFLGVCVRRQVLLVMELATFGSLRSQLEKATPVQKNNELGEEIIITSSIFGKDLTYKMILQIASGLSYLHTHHIVFRDLKPDNILVMSMDIDAAINVKLSDYGISKFATPQGVSGLIGTIAYMAPEVIGKQAYTAKVDIYSLGLVMFEILTGIPPPASDNQPMASQRNVTFEAAPVHTMKVTLNVNFLPLEHLMSECWSYYMEDRPSAKDVVKMLKNETFMIVRDSLWLPPFSQLDLQVTCVFTCKSHGRWTVWISESAINPELNDRFMSVYDLKSSQFNVWRKKIPGPKIKVMAKVRNKIWMACEGCNQLEEIVKGKENQFEIKAGQSLEDVPTTLLCHTLKKNTEERELSIVLTGQMNGKVTTFSFSDSSDRASTLTTTLNLSNNDAVSSIVSTREDLVVATCGFIVFFLDVHPQAISQNNVHLIASVKSSFSFFLELNIKEHILSLTPQDGALWCIFKDTNLLLKLNCESKEVLENVCLTWDSKRDQIRVEQASEVSSFHSKDCFDEDEVFIQKTGKSATLPSLPSRNMNMYGSQEFGTAHKDVSENICTQERQFLKDNETMEIHTEETKIPIVGASLSDVQIEISLSQSAKTDPLPLDDINEEENVYANFINQRPPIPPRSRANTVDVNEMRKMSENKSQQFSTVPPSIPRKMSTPEKEVALTAVCLCSDLLVVASSCGGFVLIPVGINENLKNKNQVTFPSHSTQYPVLRHPKQKSKVKKSSTFSQKSDEFNTESGCISHFSLAEEKLVSFYRGTDAKEQYRKSRFSRRRAYLDKRLGPSFGEGPEDQTPILNTLSERGTDFLDPCDHDRNFPEIQKSEDQEYEARLADIVAWDNLSHERLDTFYSYGRHLDD